MFTSENTYKRSHNPHKGYDSWLVLCLGFCLFFAVFAGGANCQCPPPPEEDTNGESAQADAGPPQPDCYCVAPGSSCRTDNDCRTQVKYCIVLVCIKGTCEEPREPVEEPIPEEPPDPPPGCPATCKTDSECDHWYCGERKFCRESQCQDSGIIRP